VVGKYIELKIERSYFWKG